jgi:hypothetical protein
MIENITVAGSLILKVSGLSVSLGIEQFVTPVDAAFLYNLLSVAIIMFIAAMSGPRSEAAFTIIVPIFAGMMEWFGWLTITDPVTRLPSASATNGLVLLTVTMAVFGVFMYMNEQNKQNYGTLGPGSKLFNVAFFLLMFTAAITLTSGFSIFPAGNPQPIPGACAIGFTCDQYNNIDFNSNIGSISNSGGLLEGAASAVAALPAAIVSILILILKIIIGVIAFPLVLNEIVGGLYPGIQSNAAYAAFLIFMELGILLIYAQGFFELIYKPSGGSTI